MSDLSLTCDVLVVGSGAAGLTLALSVAAHADVILLSKVELEEGSTLYAQGGIAAVFDEQDSIDSHVADTMIAGVGYAILILYAGQQSRLKVRWRVIEQGVCRSRCRRRW